MTIWTFWKNIITVIAIVIVIPIVASAGDEMKKMDYSHYNQLLADHVDAKGRVNYEAIKTNPENLLFFLEQLKKLSPENYQSWSANQKIAFWTNAYNAITIKVIVDHYPIKASGLSALTYPSNSIRQIAGAWTKKQFSVKGELKTLDQIEHEILRKQFTDPRIHMALVCAAISCPYLRQQAYTGQLLDKQFDDQSKRFLTGDTGLQIDRKKKKVHLSSIFKWFGSDFKTIYSPNRDYQKFGNNEKAVLQFVSSYVDIETKHYLAEQNYSIHYLHYDWTLNMQQ